MSANHYTLTCTACGHQYDDTTAGFRLTCDADHAPALLRAQYGISGWRTSPYEPGLFRFRDWLPVRRSMDTTAKAVVWQSTTLAKHLGLDHLFLAFNGYWPERGAEMVTCSIKELQAPAVLARIPDGESRSMVVASAGNTARAFLHYGSIAETHLTVVIPEAALTHMWGTVPKHPNVKLIVVEGGDYLDAMSAADTIAALDGYYPEGGPRNAARRDGMGTVILSAYETMGRLPNHYVQAVGSGTGAIAAWEMIQRIHQATAGIPQDVTLHLAQNTPCTPMTDAWHAGTRELDRPPAGSRRQAANGVYATMLSNPQPPYAVTGGVYDALRDTDGSMYAVGKQEAEVAGRLFRDTEGCDLDPAAEVALAALRQALQSETISPADTVLLNLTGGGYVGARRANGIITYTPDVALQRGVTDRDAIEKALKD